MLGGMLRRRKVHFECSDELLRKHEDAPKLMVQVSDVASVGSCSIDEATCSSRFSKPFDPEPLVPQSVVLIFGFVVFLLAVVWPPLILLLAYIASKLIPYSFRENDEASNRRQLYHEFCKEDDLPENFKCIPETIQVTEEYIVNER